MLGFHPNLPRYDGHGRRAQATTAAGSIFSQYSQTGQLLYQEDERSAKDSVYVYLGGSLVATLKLWSGGYAVEYQHTDALGSPVAVTDANRVVIEKSEYEPYGGLLNRPIKDGPGYTGHVSDAATGLSYMQQRYYDSMLAGGRFLSVDPVTATSVGGNFNRYWYANNNPYRFTDPDGRVSDDPRRQPGREQKPPPPPPPPCSAQCMRMRSTSDNGQPEIMDNLQALDQAGTLNHEMGLATAAYFLVIQSRHLPAWLLPELESKQKRNWGQGMIALR